MSTKSKTGARLVDSIRKSKSGTVARKTAERPDADKSATTKSKVSTTRSKSSAPKSVSKASTNTVRKNGFSHSRRVWPD